jgi:hypothetical protein
MIEKFIGFFHRQFLLAENTQRNQKAIEALRQDVQRLQISMERLAAEVTFIKATERLEREKLMLQLNNVLAQFEHQLPPKAKH